MASVSVACADAPNAPSSATAFEPVLVVSDPPPPPADGDPVTACEPDVFCPPAFEFILNVDAKYFRAPGSNIAHVTFSMSDPADPTVVISPDARVRDTGNGLVGRGTITATVLLDEPIRIVADLTTAFGSLVPKFNNALRWFEFRTRTFDAVTGEEIFIPTLFSYAF